MSENIISDQSTDTKQTLSSQDSGSERVNIGNDYIESMTLVPYKLMKDIPSYGITSPMSLADPHPYEFELNEDFFKCLQEFDIFESREELERRVVVLSRLNSLVKTWIIELLKKDRLPESDARRVGGHIRTFGSYRLGVHTRGADIDVLMLVPRHITRDDFYDSFSSFMCCRNDIKDLRCIREAYVPVMKFRFSGIDIDLLFCQLPMFVVPDDIKLDDPTILRGMDMKDIRSLNGFRVADKILSLIPNPHHFRLALHALKLWSKNQGLYSNILGFSGGISWAIMLARVCQLYPKALPSTLFEKFFLVYSNWSWDEHPVILQKIIFGPCSMTLPQWHINSVDQNKLMSVITPTYPEQNSTHNVTVSTRAIMIECFEKALESITNMINNKLSWKDIFSKVNFFHQYNHFLVVTAKSETSKGFIEWTGYVESKLRWLVVMLEKSIMVSIAHPHVQSYGPSGTDSSEFVRRWFIGIRIQKLESDSNGLRVDLSPEAMRFLNEAIKPKVMSIYYPGSSINFGYVKRRNIFTFIPKEVYNEGLEKKSGRHKSTSKATTSMGVKRSQPVSTTDGSASKAHKPDNVESSHPNSPLHSTTRNGIDGSVTPTVLS